MYAPGGFLGSELGDVEVVPRGDELHLFHLTLPNHDVVGHAVTRDGIEWHPRTPALRTGDPGEPDDDQIWTMGVAEERGRWHMLYTALSTVDRGRVQRVGLATSDDLVSWQKRGIVAQADPRHYDLTGHRRPWVAFRDPKPVRVGDRWYATVCANDVEHHGVVGLLGSADLRTWTVEPPLFGPTRWFELECPQVFDLDGRWVLTASVMEDRSQRYWVADDFFGPYRAPPDNRLAPPGHYAARVCRWRGRTLLFAMHRGKDGNRLLSPLELRTTGDAITAHPWEGWADYEQDTQRETGGVLSAGAKPERLPDPWVAAHFHYAAKVELRCRAAGFDFAVRGRHFLRVEWVPGEGAVRLLRCAPGNDGRGHPWFDYEVLAEAPCGPPESIALRVAGGEIEAVADGRVVLSTWAPVEEGKVSLFAEDGALQVERTRFTHLRCPG